MLTHFGAGAGMSHGHLILQQSKCCLVTRMLTTRHKPIFCHIRRVSDDYFRVVLGDGGSFSVYMLLYSQLFVPAIFVGVSPVVMVRVETVHRPEM